MEIRFINFEDASLAMREEIWTLYRDSFPQYERRSRQAHHAALNDTVFRSEIAVNDKGELLGLLFYWIDGNMLFIEHIAVNPAMRGQNIGSEIIEGLVSAHAEKSIILEIDPPQDEISIRRQAFYERLGFVVNDYEYIHPSYAKGDKAHPHPLVIMSYGRKISEKEFDDFKEFLFDTLLKYTD